VVGLFVISGVINILALTGSFYMLQIYDRALTSRSVETLLGLTILAIGLYAFQGVLDVIRSQVLIRAGALIDDRLSPTAHRVALDMPRHGYATAEAADRARDVDVLRQFVSGSGPAALLDLPWMPLYLGFVYILHPLLAVLVLCGAVLLAFFTLLTEIFTKRHAAELQKASVRRAMMSDTHLRSVEALRAMGFLGRAVARFEAVNREHLKLQMKTNDISGSFGGLSKVVRMIMQSAVLGLGAYLTIAGELSAGAIIAASVASARALSPIDQAIGQWKGLVAARRAFSRLKETLAALADAPQMDLPAPTTNLKVEKVTVAAPGSGTIVLADVAFELRAGQALGLIGPSGSGKSSFARAVTGVWPVLRGAMRLDDADIKQWDADALGLHLGYLPQDVALIDGTIAENIARFEPGAGGREIISAARLAGVHEMILRLPDGYETRIGASQTVLSAGQRQRVALARAVYGSPFLVVLDEPNSNLDSEGEAALTRCIETLRERGSIVIVIAHRPSALAAVDTLGILQTGKLIAFGPKDEVIARHLAPTPVPASQPAATEGDPKWVRRSN
jgi:ATP-binding cassette subfamily C protein